MPKAVSSEVKQSIGNRLARLLDREGMSQQELATALDVHLTVVNRIIRAEASPGTDLLIAIADYFECSVDYLIGRKNEKII